MGYSPSVVKKIRDEYSRKRERAVELSVTHQHEAYAKCSVLREIDRALSMTGLNIYKASFEGKQSLEKKIESIKKENAELQKQKRDILKMNGFPEDYTDIKYECESCADTGYVGINMCSCMKKALVKEAYSQSGLGKVLEKQTFENFDLSYYPENQLEQRANPRAIMQNILDKSKKFVKDFGNNEAENLLFVGGTGLGKTHLTTAIAKGVIDKGFDVVYDSAQNIIRAFEKQRFDGDETAISDVERFFDCDLLIVDDLGTEFKNSFTQSALYNLINTRINSAKSMIISTNLDELELIRKTYDDRITSRLIGSFRTFKFEGQDIRIVKAKTRPKQ